MMSERTIAPADWTLDARLEEIAERATPEEWRVDLTVARSVGYWVDDDQWQWVVLALCVPFSASAASRENVQAMAAHVVAFQPLSAKRLLRERREAVELLDRMLAETDEYVRINKLHAEDGSPASTQTMRQARACLSRIAEKTE
jgi:DNA-binding IclR family transcriptional regulator